mmetsp:Transcript_12714/g.18116  ORF Transcript_12714/g.18116 Transcript_12714/m.18116 type:complete len:403 (+) Transcript_12714:1096-2304(+)
MEHLGFKACKADSEVWMRPAVTDDGRNYWEFVLLYVDDVLCVSNQGIDVIKNEIGHYFQIKHPDKVGPPDIYLGNKVTKVQLENGKSAWSLSSSQYVQDAVKNVEDYFITLGKTLPKKANYPLKGDYRPTTDLTTELDSKQAAYYQSLIGVLRWIVELGRADISTEASMMSSFMTNFRVGHLEQTIHIFGYLKSYHNSEMVFDPSLPNIDEHDFGIEDWGHSVYNGAKETLPPNAPEPKGDGFIIRQFVDSDHTGIESTRRSRTGFITYLHSAPIYWFSKRQGSVQTSTFGSEFTALKEACEYSRGLNYKLRMMGIPVNHPTYVYCDNQSVATNSSIPTSVLKKKSSSIAYHFVREGVAANKWRLSYIFTHENIADMFTESLKDKSKRLKFIRTFLHHVGEN